MNRLHHIREVERVDKRTPGHGLVGKAGHDDPAQPEDGGSPFGVTCYPTDAEVIGVEVRGNL